MRMNRPSWPSACNAGSRGSTMESALPPSITPASSSPSTEGCPIRRASSPRSFVAMMIAAMDSKRDISLSSRLAFQVRVPLEARDVLRDEHVRYVARDRRRRLHLPPERRQQVRRPELHVVQHFRDRITVHEIGDLVSLLRQANVNGIGITEQVVEVAEDLLIRARQENPEHVEIRVAERMQRHARLAGPAADETVDLAVRIARDVLERPLASRLLAQAMNRHDRKQLVDRPAVRERLEQREVAEVAVHERG